MIRVAYIEDLGWTLVFQRGVLGGFQYAVPEIKGQAERACHVAARDLWGTDAETCSIPLEELYKKTIVTINRMLALTSY